MIDEAEVTTDERGRPRLTFQATDAEESMSRFGRSRFLKVVGGALFGTFAAMAVNASPAYAAACGTTDPGLGCGGRMSLAS